MTTKTILESFEEFRRFIETLGIDALQINGDNARIATRIFLENGSDYRKALAAAKKILTVA